VAYEGFFQLGHRQMIQKEQDDVDRLNERINDLQRQLNELKLKN
jgi:polyhydroxyalkanoate synthesis regulator phasin